MDSEGWNSIVKPKEGSQTGAFAVVPRNADGCSGKLRCNSDMEMGTPLELFIQRKEEIIQ